MMAENRAEMGTERRTSCEWLSARRRGREVKVTIEIFSRSDLGATLAAVAARISGSVSRVCWKDSKIWLWRSLSLPGATPSCPAPLPASWPLARKTKEPETGSRLTVLAPTQHRADLISSSNGGRPP